MINILRARGEAQQINVPSFVAVGIAASIRFACRMDSMQS